MIRNAGKLMMVAVALFSTASWAGPLALWVGQTSFLGFPGKGCQVTVSNESVIEVVTSKSGAEIRAKHPGTSQVTLKLRDGDTHQFTVHVTPSGAEVYSTSRAESEHSGFSLSPAPAASKSGTAQANKADQGKASKTRTAERDAKADRPRA
ncbi:pilus assembly protein N-terminal domain-containing protein [Hyalangium versicolor]|uniref:pilus assembly protein N-terminal domain-containing protein n=1 Tax=Hyalangium versicolor TaxID=2861190 RepID=UPI001CCAE16D|nr:pilus assembly protein N-terminal domain-containing protein [Hyalangium versicolor]